MIAGYSLRTIALSSEVKRLPLPFFQSSTRLSVTFHALLQILAHVLRFEPIPSLREGSDERSGEFVAGVSVLDEYIRIKVDGFDLEALVPPHGNKIKLISLYFVPQKNNDLRSSLPQTPPLYCQRKPRAWLLLTPRTRENSTQTFICVCFKSG